MIVVIGNPLGSSDPVLGLAGATASVAAAAARAGAQVQLIGRVGEDAAGDALVLALARAGVGHAAVLRDPSSPTPVVDAAPTDHEFDPLRDEDTMAPSGIAGAGPVLEPADVELGLQYLRDYRVVVVAEPQPLTVVQVAVEAADWSGARLIVVGGPDTAVPPDAILLEPPADDPDGTFASLVGELAAAIDAGSDAATALAEITQRSGWTRSPDESEALAGDR